MIETNNEISQASELVLNNGDRLLQITLILIAGGMALLAGMALISILRLPLSWLAPKFSTQTYIRVLVASKNIVLVLLTLSAMEVMLLLIPQTEWLSLIEFCLSVGISILSGWMLSRLFRDFFNTTILGVTFESNPQVKGESIFLLRYFGDFAIAVALILSFCISHNINVLGIVASLGIGGIAIAFAAQKTLEQFLGGIVLNLDRPFTVGDYIGLSDGQQGKQGTFGRVESIGLRSTKIRTSGKGTLTIIPNNALTQATIENFSGAKKVMSVMMIEFPKPISANEQALIRQTVMDSTMDIFGLDWRSTEVAFGDNHAQISFFILGSNELSMELRRQLLDLATQQITKQLQKHNISFILDQPTIYVDSPISI
ncbi:MULTISPECIES: mechanosensitive ion channel family protein [Kamptonema]|uniref:mechanosensitive ion channel family protein n=1 Tax=Kamptonema TaxID=1501433 RepID=UPI0001DAC670|nr:MULTISPECIES: mechanosensitive ion channel domain-containing protein [Kamptonema]CBN54346.1 putative Mechanosensitive (MS) ion channel [Kamptonema sp. PCC 6506]